jgi:hypothetical protein
MTNKKMDKKIEVNVSNKLFYTVITILAVLLIGVGVYAYGTNNPSVMGHSISEIEPPQYCEASGGWLRHYNGAWHCDDTPSGSGDCPECENCEELLVHCSWGGWNSVCSTANYPDYYYTQYDQGLAPSVCVGDSLSYLTTSYYCSEGGITDSKSVRCCPMYS